MIADRLIAHRGGALLAPENTLGAMTLTREIGCGWVEIDANRLGDGTLVMFHDDRLDRLTGTKGRLSQCRWQDVEDLDIGSHFSTRFQRERIATLASAVGHIDSLSLGLNLEIKVYPDYTPEQIVFGTIDVLEAHWRDFDRLIISSFSTEVLRLLRLWRPQWQIGHLWQTLPKDWADLATELGLVSVHCDHRHLSAERAQAVKHRGLDLYCYTVNDPDAANRLWAMGVDGIITDDPQRFNAP